METLDTMKYKNLVAGDMKIATENITIPSGNSYKAGSVLGKKTASVGSPSAGGGNTGNGTISNERAEVNTKVGTYSLECVTALTDGGTFSVTDPDGNSLPNAKVGSYSGTGDGTLTNARLGNEGKDGYYSVKCTSAATNSGTFEVTDPDGNSLGSVTIPAGAGNSVDFNHEQIKFKLTDGSTDFILNDEFTIAPYRHDQISFDIRDGSTDFVIGDTFTIAVTAGSNDCVIVDSDLSNGAQNPYCVLAEDVDASTESKEAVGYLTGQFNRNIMYVGGDDKLSDHEADLRKLSIFAIDVSEG